LFLVFSNVDHHKFGKCLREAGKRLDRVGLSVIKPIHTVSLSILFYSRYIVEDVLPLFLVAVEAAKCRFWMCA